MSHTVSPEQLAANRANAASSTGPRTPEGKLRSSQNARKHGFTATSFAVVRLEDLNEVATNEDPIGKRIKWSRDPNSKAPWMTIVGISGDVKAWRLNAQPLPEMFTPLSQQPQAFLFLAIRTWSADPTPVAGAVRAALRQLDRDQPITEVRSMRSTVSESLTDVKYVSRLTALFAAIAMLMAAMGIYGVIGYSVARRTHEFGVRMVLGAGAADVVRLVLRQALYVVAIGLVIGMAGALVVSRLLASWLYGVGEHDPLTFTLVPLALGAIALLASYIPARRATRVDPAVALRCE